MFLPTTKEEMDALGWDAPDVVLVTGDAYIDSPHMGIAVIGHVLMKAGYRAAVIAQPDVNSPDDITRLGEPKLFWGVSAGAVDSMVANYTASKKPRRNDDYTPGGVNDKRPDRACMVYTNLIRRYYKNTRPIMLGGVEASLRRVAHYDFWSNKVRGSILFDAKADYLIYGMGERPVLEFALALSKGESPNDIRGLAYKSHEVPEGAVMLPSFEECRDDKQAFIKMYRAFYENCDPVRGKTLAQKHGPDRYLIQNPPAKTLSQKELDAIYALPYERELHPYYKQMGEVKALETIRYSITTHRGCYGECNFCAIAVHEGRTVQWRSEESILKEIENIAQLPGFKGTIPDLGGPTANMYGFECEKKLKYGACKDRRCLFPQPCPSLHISHENVISLLEKARKIPGVKKIVVASGIRYDMILADPGLGTRYLKEICDYHVSGQMKVAPEHDKPAVLSLMGKPGADKLLEFRKMFERVNKTSPNSKQFLTYYFIAAHPGCTLKDMQYLKRFADENLHMTPEQTQIFTPTPSTWSTLMYYTETDPFTNTPLFVEKDPIKRQKQKDALVTRFDTAQQSYKKQTDSRPQKKDNRPAKSAGSHSFVKKDSAKQHSAGHKSEGENKKR